MADMDERIKALGGMEAAVNAARATLPAGKTVSNEELSTLIREALTRSAADATPDQLRAAINAGVTAKYSTAPAVDATSHQQAGTVLRADDLGGEDRAEDLSSEREVPPNRDAASDDLNRDREEPRVESTGQDAGGQEAGDGKEAGPAKPEEPAKEPSFISRQWTKINNRVGKVDEPKKVDGDGNMAKFVNRGLNSKGGRIVEGGAGVIMVGDGIRRATSRDENGNRSGKRMFVGAVEALAGGFLTVQAWRGNPLLTNYMNRPRGEGTGRGAGA